ncbi:MAG: D-sedoheptulose-7-phosphate isomerase [Thermoplasmata archaeon]
MTAQDGLPGYVHRYLEEAKASLEEAYIQSAVARIVPELRRARREGRTIFFLGNGGSAATASHFVTDIAKATMGKTLEPGRRYRCLALNDNVPSITAWANDFDYDLVFAEQLRTLGGAGDVVVAISGSGNSPNVLAAVEVARAGGMFTIGLTGIGGGQLRSMVDVALVVPSNSMQHTEDVHLSICHLLTAYLRDEVGAETA